MLIVLVFVMAPVSANETSVIDGPSEHVVEIVNFVFTPAELIIKPGDTVTWINRDFVPHDVAGNVPDTWRSPKLGKDEAFSIVLNTELSYFCSLHESVMKGKVSFAAN